MSGKHIGPLPAFALMIPATAGAAIGVVCGAFWFGFINAFNFSRQKKQDLHK